MRRITLWLLLATLILAASAASVQAHTVFLNKTATARNSCDKPFTVQEYRSYAKRVYKRTKVSWKAQNRMSRMHTCQHSFRARVAVGRHHRRYMRDRQILRQILQITPYPGPNGTRWAVPWRVVYCESGTTGLWSAANRSGAVGPYQLLGHGAPFPADTPAKRLRHHIIAANLYRNSGLGPWTASRGCWG